jgi:hypothetical protein
MNTIPTAILVFGAQTPLGPVPLGSLPLGPGGELNPLRTTKPGLEALVCKMVGLALQQFRKEDDIM